ncbi:hypothetical protein BJ912DRAFT_515174 [Pholiota molesta]|nr:hypothetical protein BJ912DRAFT_515174 [Pholiota molesta]
MSPSTFAAFVSTTSSKFTMAVSFGQSSQEAKTAALARLPSYDQATAAMDIARLPSYRVTRRSSRYHPYRFNVPILVDGIGIDRLFNTIYDEEYVRIHVPPAPVRPLPTQPLLPGVPWANPNDTVNANNHHNGAYAPHPDVQEFDHRAQNVAAVILQEFVAGVVRAREA